MLFKEENLGQMNAFGERTHTLTANGRVSSAKVANGQR